MAGTRALPASAMLGRRRRSQEVGTGAARCPGWEPRPGPQTPGLGFWLPLLLLLQPHRTSLGLRVLDGRQGRVLVPTPRLVVRTEQEDVGETGARSVGPGRCSTRVACARMSPFGCRDISISSRRAGQCVTGPRGGAPRTKAAKQHGGDAPALFGGSGWSHPLSLHIPCRGCTARDHTQGMTRHKRQQLPGPHAGFQMACPCIPAKPSGRPPPPPPPGPRLAKAFLKRGKYSPDVISSSRPPGPRRPAVLPGTSREVFPQLCPGAAGSAKSGNEDGDTGRTGGRDPGAARRPASLSRRL